MWSKCAAVAVATVGIVASLPERERGGLGLGIEDEMFAASNLFPSGRRGDTATEWESDGSPGLVYGQLKGRNSTRDYVLVRPSIASQTVLFIGDNGLKYNDKNETSAYWRVNIAAKDIRNIDWAVGLSNPDFIGLGEESRGAFFNGLQLTNGEQVMLPSYGYSDNAINRSRDITIPQLCLRCKSVEVLLFAQYKTAYERNNPVSVLDVYYIQNGIALGKAFSVKQPPAQMYLAVQFTESRAAAVVEQLPVTQMQKFERRETRPIGNVSGDWIVESAQLDRLFANFTDHKNNIVSNKDFVGLAVYAAIDTSPKGKHRWSSLLMIKSVNSLTWPMKCVPQETKDASDVVACEVDMLMTTLMATNSSQSAVEAILSYLLSDSSVVFTVSQADGLTIGNDVGSIKLVRKDFKLEAVTESPFSASTTKVKASFFNDYGYQATSPFYHEEEVYQYEDEI